MNDIFDLEPKHCPQCEKAIDSDARFCKFCAFDLQSGDEVQHNSAESAITKPKTSAPAILSIIGILLIAVVSATVYFYAAKPNQAQAENTNSVQPAPISALNLSEKAQQLEEKILRGESLNSVELEGLSPSELRILRNVHFARYGRRYDRPGLGDYFYNRPWYKPNDAYSDNLISSTDKENINLILAKENALNNPPAVAAASPTPEPLLSPTPVTGELTREGALALLTGWNRAINFNYPREGGKMVERLMKDKIISCEKFYPMQGYTDGWRWRNCAPTAKLQDATVNYWTINIPIGFKVANRVTGVSKLDQNTAYADVVFTFQEGVNYDLYTKYFAENSDINFGEESQRFLFRLYDDGWRVERNKFGGY